MEDWPLGDWWASKTLRDGSSVESILRLGADGRYAETLRQVFEGTERVVGGHWTFDPAKELLTFQPDANSDLGQPPVTLGLAGCDLRFQPAAEGKPGMAASWLVRASSKPTNTLSLMCLDPPRLTATSLYYIRRRPPAGPAAPMPPLTRLNDPEFGQLVWDGTWWVGRVPFCGRTVGLHLWPMLAAPTAEEQREIINRWRGALERLAEAEPKLRQQTALEMAEALQEVQENEMPPQALADSLELLLIELSTEAALNYVSLEFLGETPITTCLNEDLSFREVEMG